jgi:peptide/nickel transport system permease protein
VGKSLAQRAIWRLLRDRLTMTAMSVLGLLALLSILAPLISEYILNVNPNLTDASQSQFLPVLSPGHILGTDHLGRDQLARLLYAGRVSLGIGFSSAGLSLVVGLAAGIVTGFYGGIVDDIVNWLVTTVNAIPGLVLLLVIAAIFSPDPVTLILVLAFLTWTGTTRLARGETFSIREREYVIGARALGASNLRIMLVHILPNLFSIVIVALAIQVGNVILIESALSFLGIGVQPPTATWGNMLSRSQSFFNSGPHLVIFPGLLITITVLCLYIIGDGFRDAFDPTTVD